MDENNIIQIYFPDGSFCSLVSSNYIYERLLIIWRSHAGLWLRVVWQKFYQYFRWEYCLHLRGPKSKPTKQSVRMRGFQIGINDGFCFAVYFKTLPGCRMIRWCINNESDTCAQKRSLSMRWITPTFPWKDSVKWRKDSSQDGRCPDSKSRILPLFCSVSTYILVEIYRRFGVRMYCSHLQDWKVSWWNK
jgi:hypothetical protein